MTTREYVDREIAELRQMRAEGKDEITDLVLASKIVALEDVRHFAACKSSQREGMLIACGSHREGTP